MNYRFEHLVETDNLLSFEAAGVYSAVTGGVSPVAFLYLKSVLRTVITLFPRMLAQKACVAS